MPGLFYLKYQTGKSLGSASLMADSKQTLACAMLSVALLIGLGLNYWFGIWQADPVIGLVIVALLIREGYHALKDRKTLQLRLVRQFAPVPRGLISPETSRPHAYENPSPNPEADSGFFPAKLGKSPIVRVRRRQYGKGK